MNKSQNTNLIKTEAGVSILIFSFTIIALFAFIALAIDSANLFLANTKMQNIGDSANLTSLNVRIERGPQMKNGATYECPFSSNLIQEGCVKTKILPVAGALLKQNLGILGFTSSDFNDPTAGNNYTMTNGATGLKAVLNYIDCRVGGTACFNPEANSNDSTLSISNEYEYFTTTITYDVPLLLMHTVPFGMLGINAPVIGNTLQLKTVSHLILPSLNLAILADISGSMTGAKLTDLQAALTNFVNNFRPDRDKLSFWPFNLQVSPAQSVPITRRIDQGFDLATIIARINALNAAGNTNPADALLAAYNDFRTRGGAASTSASTVNAGIIGDTTNGSRGEYTMVLFSDGAPTAMTAQFAQHDSTNFTTMFEVGMQDTSITGFNDIDNPDYITGPEIMRADSQGGTTCSAGQTYNNGGCQTTPPATVYTYGMPSLFYRTSITPLNPDSLPLVNCPTAGSPTAGSLGFGRLAGKTNYDIRADACGSEANAQPNPAHSCAGSVPTNGIQSNAQCLDAAYPAGTNTGNFLGFTLPLTTIPLAVSATQPFANEAAFRNQTATGPAGTIQPIGFKKQFYNNLIAMSDFIRSQMGYIYTVGVGDAAPVATADDPYQNVRDNSSMKVNLLARVAADPNAVTAEFGFTNPFVTGTCTGPSGAAPDFTTAPVTTNCGDAWRGSTRKGENINTNNSSNLDRIFQTIARRLQTRVVVDPKSRTRGAAHGS